MQYINDKWLNSKMNIIMQHIFHTSDSLSKILYDIALYTLIISCSIIKQQVAKLHITHIITTLFQGVQI